MEIKIKLSNYNKNNIEDSIKFIDKKIQFFMKDKNFINIIKKYNILKLPCTKKLYTVLRSPHVNKTARDQFELKQYKYLIKLKLNITNQNKYFIIILLKLIKSTNNFINIEYIIK